MVGPPASGSIRLLQLVLTEGCPLACRYCLQRPGRARMSRASAADAVERFGPSSGGRWEIHFGGGEPLLEFPLIEDVVDRAGAAARKAGARIGFGISTNGLLCGDDAVELFARRRFRLALSHDGEAQDAQRGRGTRAALDALLDRLVRTPSIRLETNSVFSPENVGRLSSTLLGFLERGVRSVRFAPAYGRVWPRERLDAFGREVERLRRAVAPEIRRTGRVPVRNFARALRARPRYCPAGRDRIAVDPRGGLWGCAALSEWARAADPRAARRFRLGRLGRSHDPASRVRPAVSKAYADLAGGWSESPSGPCALCPDRARCWVCPALAALSGGGLASIPGHVCRLNRIQARAAARLAADLERP